jgi:hypothetical protein
VIVEVYHLGPTRGLPALHVRGAFDLDRRFGHAQADYAVDRSAAAGELVLVVLDGDLVAEEFRRSGSPVGYERLVLGEFQLEIITQERCEACFDFLCFGLRPDEPEQVIVRVPYVAQPSIARIVKILAGQAA